MRLLLHGCDDREQEDRHAEHEVDEVGPVEPLQGPRIDRLDRHDALRPARELDHHRSVLVTERERQRREAEAELHPEDDQDREVHVGRRLAHPRVEEAAMQQERQADEADRTGDSARDDRDELLLRGRHHQRVDRLRRQQPDRVAEEQEEEPSPAQEVDPGPPGTD